MNRVFDKITRSIDRIISGSLGKQVLFFLFLAVVVFALLFAARIFFFSQQSEFSSDDIFWDTISNFYEPGGFENVSGSERWLMLFVNLSGMVIFAGVLIALLTNTIYQRIDKVKNGEAYYSFSNHIIVIGYDHICDNLAEQLAGQNEFVLLTSHDVNEVRRELFYSLDDRLKKNVTIINGNRVLFQDIKKLNVQKCKQVFLLGDMNEDAHDSKNVECLKIINKIVSDGGRKNLRCHVLFADNATFTAFEQQEIPELRNNIDLVPFNFHDMWAQKVFVKNEYAYKDGHSGISRTVAYKHLDHEPITADSPMHVHFVILGMSNMGIALGMQAAQICHFPNFITQGIKTRITFIDEAADIKMNSLKIRLRNLFSEVDYSYQCFADNTEYNNKSAKNKFTDIELEFIKARFEDEEVQRYLGQAAMDKTSYLTIAATLPDSSAALAAALYLPPEVYDSDTSVLVRQEHSHAIVSMLSHKADEKKYSKYRNLRPFGMINNCFEYTQADDILPMMIKYTYDKTSSETEQAIMDFDEEAIRKNWEENWREGDNLSALKASNRYAANFMYVKQRSLGVKEGIALNADQINLAARMEHNRWIIEKLLVGYRAPTPEEAVNMSKENKEYYKARFIHQDIKAYQTLEKNERNIDVKLYDINISNALPYMLKVGKKK